MATPQVVISHPLIGAPAPPKLHERLARRH